MTATSAVVIGKSSKDSYAVFEVQTNFERTAIGDIVSSPLHADGINHDVKVQLVLLHFLQP